MRFENLTITRASLEEVVSLFERAADPALHSRRDHWRAWVEYHLNKGPCFAARRGERLVGAGGIDIVRPGIGTPWIVLDGTVERLPKGKLPTAEDLDYLESTLGNLGLMLRNLCEVFELSRLRSESYKAFPASQRLLEFLGFRRLRREKPDRYFYRLEIGAQSCRQP